MKKKINNDHFLTLKTYTADEISYLIDLSIQLKKEKERGKFKNRLKNKSIAMIFEKTSTRTRCATSVACYDEGAHAEFLGKSDIQMGKKESLKDTARVLGRMFDAIVYRGFEQETVEILAEYSNRPVINALTDLFHPTQIIADLMTIKMHYNRLNGIKLAFLGDGCNNVANSILIGGLKMGLDISIGAPKQYWPDQEILETIKKEITDDPNRITLQEDPIKAVQDADVIYTDVWVSMGQEDEPTSKEKIKLLKPYVVNKQLMESTGKDNSIFLHCLPASHDGEKHSMEVTEDVFESPSSLVFDQAENRLHTIKAILIALLGG